MRRARLLSLVVVPLMLCASWGGHAVGQEPAQDGVDGTTYTSPQFGYSISWDDAVWSATGADSRDAGDTLVLEVRDAETGLFELVGLWWNVEGTPHDAEGWLDFLVARLDSPNTSDVRQAESGGKPIGGHDATSAYVVYEYRYNDTSFVEYIECREVTPGTAGLCVQFLTTRDLFNSQLPLVQDLLSTLTLPAGDLLDPHAIATP